MKYNIKYTLLYIGKNSQGLLNIIIITYAAQNSVIYSNKISQMNVNKIIQQTSCGVAVSITQVLPNFNPSMGMVVCVRQIMSQQRI